MGPVVINEVLSYSCLDLDTFFLDIDNCYHEIKKHLKKYLFVKETFKFTDQYSIFFLDISISSSEASSRERRNRLSHFKSSERLFPGVDSWKSTRRYMTTKKRKNTYKLERLKMNTSELHFPQSKHQSKFKISK